ncbi:ComEA family DNA-binding protein [Chloroflexia bacterium SDU3-3]|nr:ComEA family DNA-binding protein [Chloroflexia bacterium SDU3-3]
MDQLPEWLRQRPTIIASIVLVLAALGALLLLGQRSSGATFSAGEAVSLPTSELEGSQDEEEEPTATLAPEIVVSISGEVMDPDAYQLPANARVKDLVMAAGGLSEQADAAQINLAQRLSDEQHVHIPKLGSAPPATSAAGEGGKLNINIASAAQLEDLPGIGEVMAGNIIDYRTAHGAFQKIEDLQHVNGLGKNVYDKIAPLITIGP